MTVISAVFDAQPGREAELESALCDLVAQVAQEPGVLEYVLHRAPDQPGRYFFYERYRDQAAVDTHLATPYLQRVLALVPELCAAPPAVNFYAPLASISAHRPS